MSLPARDPTSFSNRGGVRNEGLSGVESRMRRLVAGFYSWGGKLRGTDTGPGGTGLVHCRPEFIPRRPIASSPRWPTPIG
jgi:hypothetical protein